MSSALLSPDLQSIFTLVGFPKSNAVLILSIASETLLQALSASVLP